MLFPELHARRFAKIDLDAEAGQWLPEHNAGTQNPLLDPRVCEGFVAECHRRRGVDFSYGGWMENRSTLWRGSYLDDGEKYVHLGVDFNVPAGTAVAVTLPSTVLRIDNDHPEPYGWGNRVIVDAALTDCVLVFAHLSHPESLHVGDALGVGDIFAKVGDPSVNGGWFPHLHVQAIKREHYQLFLQYDLRDLDGYGKSEDIASLRVQFPDPMDHIVKL